MRHKGRHFQRGYSDPSYLRQTDYYGSSYQRGHLGRFSWRQQDFNRDDRQRHAYGHIGRSSQSVNGYGGNGNYNSAYGRVKKKQAGFWSRNDGYSNYYGSDEDEYETFTSKILSGLSKLASKAKPNAYKKPTAQSSNLTFSPAVKSGEYVDAWIKIVDRENE